LRATTILVGRQRPDADAAHDGFAERARDLGAVEPEDQDVHPLLGLFDRRYDRRHSGVGLHDQLHDVDPKSLHSKLLANAKLDRGLALRSEIRGTRVWSADGPPRRMAAPSVIVEMQRRVSGPRIEP